MTVEAVKHIVKESGATAIRVYTTAPHTDPFKIHINSFLTLDSRRKVLVWVRVDEWGDKYPTYIAIDQITHIEVIV